ncbi:MAG: translocation/assembly module TamB domain-containing protein [Rhodospirillaceae bacterium]
MARARRILAYAGIAFATLVVVAGAAVIALDTRPGLAFLARTATGALSSPGSQVAVEGVSGSLWDTLRIEKLAVADADGPWLRLEDVVLDWRPSALVSRRVAIERLSAAKVEVLRAPAPAPDPRSGGEPSGIEWPPPRLPVDIAVERLDVATVALAEPVLGVAASLGVEGMLAIDGNLRARLAIARHDGGAGGARLDAAYGRDDRRLRLSLAVDEPAGGLIARLAGQPDLPPVHVGFEGEGAIPGFAGRLTARLGNRAAVDTAVSIDGGAAGPVLRLDGRADVAGLLEGTAATLLAEGLAFDVAVREDGESIVVQTARIDAAGLRIDATAHVDPESLDGRAAIDVAVAGDSATAAQIPAVRFASARLRLAAEGNLLRAPLDVSASIEEPAVDGARVRRLNLTARLAPETPWSDPALALRADATLHADGAAFGAPAAAAAIGAAPSLRIGARIEPYRPHAGDIALALDAAAAALQASGEIGADGGTLTVTGDLTRLQTLAPGVLRDGTVSMAVTVATPGGIAGTTIDAVVNGRGLAPVAPALRTVLGAAPKLEASVRIGDGMVIDVQALQLTSPGAAASAQGRLDPDGQGSDLRYTLRLDDLAAVAPGAAGKLSASGRVHGALADPSVTLRLDAPRLAAGGVALAGVDAEAEVATAVSRPRGHIRIGAASEFGPLVVETTLAAPDARRIRLPDLRIRAGEARIDGALTVNTAGPTIDGTLRSNRIALAPWSRLAGTALDGTATVALTVAPDGRRSRAELRLDGDGIAAGGVTVERLSATVTSPDALAARTFRLERLNARLAGSTISLRQPATLTLAPDAMALESFRLAVNGGEIAVDASSRPSGVRADATVTRLPLALVDALALKQGLTGRADARLSLSGPPQDIGGTLTLALADVRAAGKEAAGLPPATANLRATFGGGRLEAGARIAAGADTTADATAVVPLRLSAAPFAAALDPNASLTVDADAKGSVGRIWERLPFPTQRLAGNLGATLQVRGTTDAPSINGQVSLRNGEYEHLLLGTLLRDLTVDVVADGAAVTIRRATARDGRDGQIALTGTVDLTPGRGMPVDANATLTRFTLFNRAEGTASASGTVAMTGPVAGGTLRARLRTDRAELRIQEAPPPSVVSLDVTEVGGGRPPPPPPAPIPTSAPVPLKLDIVVEIPGQAYARGRGLDSEWAGRVTVAGTADAPKIDGDIHIVRGQFEAIGKVFRLTTGRIDLTGLPEAEPTIALTAEYTTSELTAVIHVSGSASNPKITLSSQPEVPQDEIMARILFDKGAGRLSPLEAAQLADAVATLAGGGSGAGGFLDRMRQTLGVDVLRVGAGEGTDAATLSVGKYLTEGVYVGLDQGTGPRTGAATVEIEVTPHISVESSFGTDSRVGVKWKWDY